MTPECESEIVRLWLDHWCVGEIAGRVGETLKAVNAVLRQRNLRLVKGRCGSIVKDLPDPDEIKRRCRGIREDGWRGRNGVWHEPWSELEHNRRRGWDPEPWTVPIVQSPFLPAEESETSACIEDE